MVDEVDSAARPGPLPDDWEPPTPAKTPLYPRLLRLRHLHPSAWQRAVLVEGMVALGVVLALADRASAWTPLVLPLAVALVVKFHDVLSGVIRPPDR